MPYTSTDRFTFVSWGLPIDTFGVIRFQGVEGLSTCYRFDINLVSDQTELDLAKIIGSPATFTIKRPEGDIPFNGILAEFEQEHAVGPYAFYRAVLVPKLWWLSLTHHNQVFLDMTLPEILTAVLQDGGLTWQDFGLRLKNDYPVWEYVCQYRESHLDFISRWMERDGIYYFFEQTDSEAKLILTDTLIAHTTMPQGHTFRYSQPSGLDSAHQEEVVHRFNCCQRMLPAQVSLKDYNYRAPSLELTCQAPVTSNGRGEVYLYGEHFRTPQEGQALAAIRVEEYLCQQQVFQGDSYVPLLRPGYIFGLTEHYRSDFNQNYLTTTLNHQGSQSGYLLAGLRDTLTDAEKKPYYRNTFTAIPNRIQFRPPRRTEKARFFGTMNATIDAAGSGQYAELDSQGRYKVRLPFDRSDRSGGKASAFLRMMQPYGGSDHGMHFPLHKGTEVLLTFIDGDPDRPIIAGAVPNPSNPSLVNDGTATKNLLTTAGQNKIHMEDQAGSQRVLLQTPTANSFIRMGSPNDPPYKRMLLWSADTGGGGGGDGDGEGNGNGNGDGNGEGGKEKPDWSFDKSTQKGEGSSKSFEDGFMFSTAGSLNGVVNLNYSVEVGGNKTELTIGGYEDIILGFFNHTVIGMAMDLYMGGMVEFTPLCHVFHDEVAELKGEVTKLHGEVTELKGAQTTLVTEVTNLRGEHTDLSGEVTRMQGEATHMAGEITELKGEVTRLDGESTYLLGEALEMAGSVFEMQAEQTHMSGEITEIQGAQTKMAGDITAMSGTITRLDGESTQLATNVTTLAGLITHV